MRQMADEVLADGKARAGEFHSVTTFGRDMWVAGRFSRFEQGGHPHLLLILTDITEGKSLEEQFRQAQKMESIGRLAGGVAHDFNNLLTIISGYSQMMLSEAPPGHPLRDYLLEIKKAGERATVLTRKLLAYSRRQILAPDELDPNALVQDAESVIKGVLGEDVDFVTAPGADLGFIRVDAGQLEQSLMNLAINARDAMPRGGRFTIETANVELDEAYAHTHPEVTPGPYVRLTVSDTGCGMDEATRAHIFEPFFTTKEPGKGTGLGLAMVFGFVKQSGGQMTAQSQPGRGSTFNLYFPRVSAPAAERAYAEAAPGGGETILLVEDEEDLRKLALELLTQQGYTVLEAPDGLTALRLAEAYPGAIDLLVTDVVMPGMDGRQLAGRLRCGRRSRRCSCPVTRTTRSCGMTFRCRRRPFCRSHFQWRGCRRRCGRCWENDGGTNYKASSTDRTGPAGRGQGQRSRIWRTLAGRVSGVKGLDRKLVSAGRTPWCRRVSSAWPEMNRVLRSGCKAATWPASRVPPRSGRTTSAMRRWMGPAWFWARTRASAPRAVSRTV